MTVDQEGDGGVQHKDGNFMARRIAKVAAAAVMLVAFGSTGSAEAARPTVIIVEQEGGDSLPQVAGIRWR